jgi:amino acid transporter
MTLGVVQLARGKATASFRQPWFEGSSHSPSSYSLALYSGLWSFDGWDQVTYVGGEIHHPERNIPRTIHSSMAIVTVSRPIRCKLCWPMTFQRSQLLFFVANISYFVVLDRVNHSLDLPKHLKLTHCVDQDLVSSSNTVALDFGRALFGPIGGTIFAIMVAVSCFGALNGKNFCEHLKSSGLFGPHLRRIYHNITPCFRCRSRGLSSFYVW